MSFTSTLKDLEDWNAEVLKNPVRLAPSLLARLRCYARNCLMRSVTPCFRLRVLCSTR